MIAYDMTAAHDTSAYLLQEEFHQAQQAGRSGDWPQCVRRYAQVLSTRPGLIEAYNNMGAAYRHMGQYEHALKCFQKAGHLAPDHPKVQYNLGHTHYLREHYSEALAHLIRAIELRSDYTDAWNVAALVFKAEGDYDRALAYLNHAIDLSPQQSEARWNRAALLLLKGREGLGWRDYECRFKIPHWRSIYPRRLKGPRWDGQAAPDSTILVHDEQGLGDTFQFVRYLPLVKKNCKRVIFETRKELLDLLGSCSGFDEIVERGSDSPMAARYDYHIPLMSLPGLFTRNISSSPFPTPYITAPPEKVEMWGKILPKGKLRVGVVWAGRPQHANDANRSCPLERLTPLFQHNEIVFIGLQRGVDERLVFSGNHSNFSNLGGDLHNFTDTAGILENLDLLLTVDTSVAHLAGAMGRPVWVMLPFVPDWRWGLESSRTHWYPSMRLFRQKRPKDWGSLISEINGELPKLIKTPIRSTP